MNIIGNKMFAYIDNHNDLTQSMVNQYNESLIFLGDEKQIFVPIINAYVGIGQTAYQNLLSRIGEGNDNLEEYNKYIHNDSVTSIHTQFSPDEVYSYWDHHKNQGNVAILRNETINELSYNYAFKANKNIVLKGFNDYDLPNGLDELGHTVNTFNTSGITVNIKHEGTLQEGKYVFNGKEYTYTYYNPYDVITIDDTKTWSYIKSSNTYLSNFVTKFSTDQADQVYKNILGINDGPVYVEKDFEEAFNYSDVTNILTVFEDVYVKTGNAANTFKKVTVENNAGGYTIKVKDNNNVDRIIYTNDSSKTPLSNSDLKDLLAGQGNAGLYGGYITQTTGSVETVIPVWYHKDDSPTASSYINIADGIQTLKEVAYILDVLTDGDEDDSINLAYNISYNYVEIQELKKWQNEIGNKTVSSFKSESKNDLLTVNYYSTNLWDKDRDEDGASIGKVKLDIDLRLAQTYTLLNGGTYAAYLPNHPGAKQTYIVINDDKTDINNYVKLDPSAIANICHLLNESNYYHGTNIPLYAANTDSTTNLPTSFHTAGQAISYSTLQSDLQQNRQYYIYLPCEEKNYDFTKGLTDVKWVTTYVSYVNTYLNDRINNLNVSSQIDSVIHKLSYSDTDQSSQGLFVAEVDEVDGKILVKHQKLPLDIILKNDVYYTNDIYLNISTKDAQTYKTSGNIYSYSSGEYIQLTSTQIQNLSGHEQSGFYDNIYYKTNLANMNMVPHDTSVGEMIANGANVSYFYKRTTKNYTEYLPLDIQKENTSGTLLSSDKVVADNTIYYWPGTNTNNQVKYFDVSTLQRYNGSTATIFTSYITYLAASSSTNSGLADSWDVRRTIESMFQWVNIKTNKIIG